MSTYKNNNPVIWPEAHFTIAEVLSNHSHMKEITLRFRINRALDMGIITTIGKIKPAIGRPKLVFAKANPTKKLLDAATASGVLPLTDDPAMIPIINVKASNSVPDTHQTIATSVEVSNRVLA